MHDGMESEKETHFLSPEMSWTQEQWFDDQRQFTGSVWTLTHISNTPEKITQTSADYMLAYHDPVNIHSEPTW